MDSPSAVVPRWEWRAFADRFPGVEAQVLAATPEARSSAETYLIAPPADMNAKIRFDLIDVKQRLRAERGLELWTPVVKSGFPVEAEVIKTLFTLWTLDPPRLTRPGYTKAQFLAEVIAAAPTVRVVDVTKERRGAVIDGCAVELATLSVNGRRVQTVGVEAENPDLVLRTVAALGLTSDGNENYVQALKRLDGVRHGA